MQSTLHIVGNTSSANTRFARRANELRGIVTGIGRQGEEFSKYASPSVSLTLVRTDPKTSSDFFESTFREITFSLSATIGTENPNNIYRCSSSLPDLVSRFGLLISEFEKVVEQADVVLLGGTYFVPWCLLQAARAQRKPVVLCYAGILSREITHLPGNIQAVLKIMEKDFFNQRIFYIFPSELTKRTVETEIFMSPVRRNAVIYNGVSLEFLTYESEGDKREFAVIFVGRNTPVKNPEFLVPLSEEMRRIKPEYRIAMITNPDRNNRLLETLRVRGVAVLDPMNTDSLARFYACSGAVVCPSRFETYGNVAVEAACVGTPALISPTMGVSEVFDTYGMAEYITDFANPRAVAQRLAEVVDKQIRIPPEVRQRLAKELSWPNVIRRYIDVCRAEARIP